MSNTLRPGKHLFASAVFFGIRRNDILVFDHPPDPATLYLFRCVGLPGEQLQIRDRVVFINKRAVPNPAGVKFSYLVETTRDLPRTFFNRKGCDEDLMVLPDNRYLLHLMPAQAAELGKFDFLKVSNPGQSQHLFGREDCFPHSPGFPWSADNYGPLVIPRRGWTIDLDWQNVQLYGQCIRDYEGLPGVTLEGNTLYRDGEPLSRHTFGHDYYFVLGDNRNNAFDSRYWGFVPGDYVRRKVWWHTDLF
jgi:signal peptidase I